MENSKLNFLHEVDYESINYDPSIARDLLKKNKVLVLRNYDLEQNISEWFDVFSENLGTIVDMDEDLSTGSPTGKRWISISYDESNPDKYRTASVRQPLHTDYSYIPIDNNIQFFYCKSKAERGGATIFIDIDEVVELLQLDGKSELLEKLMSIPVRHQKAERFKEKPIIQYVKGQYRINWNYYPALSGKSNIDLIEDFHQFLETRIVNSGLIHEVLLDKNDCVFFHDELLLHGRNSYFATYKGQRELMKGTILL